MRRKNKSLPFVVSKPSLFGFISKTFQFATKREAKEYQKHFTDLGVATTLKKIF